MPAKKKSPATKSPAKKSKNKKSPAKKSPRKTKQGGIIPFAPLLAGLAISLIPKIGLLVLGIFEFS